MVSLSLVLSPTVNRWANIVLSSLYVVSIVASAIGETSLKAEVAAKCRRRNGRR